MNRILMLMAIGLASILLIDAVFDEKSVELEREKDGRYKKRAHTRMAKDGPDGGGSVLHRRPRASGDAVHRTRVMKSDALRHKERKDTQAQGKGVPDKEISKDAPASSPETPLKVATEVTS